VIYQTFRVVIENAVRPIWTHLCKETKDPVKRENYIRKSCNSTAKFFYFLFSACWGYRVLKEADWLPREIGGSQDLQAALSKAFVGTPFQTNPAGIVDYGLWTFGYHLSDLFMHVFQDQRRNDYEEMLLHHIVTATLNVGYLQANFTCIGTLITFNMDLADILVSLSQSFASTRFKPVTISVFLLMCVVWAWTRLYVLPQLIYGIVADLVPNHMTHADPSWVFSAYC
jgi:hypothetical protein